MMRFPFVARERYDEKCAELDAVRAKYDALLADHMTPKPPRRAALVADRVVERLAADLAQEMPDTDAARAEAERIRREAFG